MGSGRNTIKYLSRYVFKVAIADHRIIKVHNRRVFFTYTNRETSKVIITSLDVLNFIQKYLLHVLPSGFMKVRHYGFMHSSFSLDYDKLRLIVEGFNSVMNKAAEEVPEKIYLFCSSRGKTMKYMFSILPNNTRIRGSTFTWKCFMVNCRIEEECLKLNSWGRYIPMTWVLLEISYFELKI